VIPVKCLVMPLVEEEEKGAEIRDDSNNRDSSRQEAYPVLRHPEVGL